MKKNGLLFIIVIIFPVFFNCKNPWMEQFLQPKTITFDSNGGTYVRSQTVYKDQKIKEPPPPIKSGGTFAGWFVDNETFWVDWDFNDIPVQDMTLYANWAPGPWFITGVGITVTNPATGETPDTAPPASGWGYHCNQVVWTPGDNVFQGNTRYTARVTLTVDDGYTFNELSSATINRWSASITDRTEKTVTLLYAFPATPEKAITGITIRNAPQRVKYTHNDILDLTGMVIMLSFEDDTTEDVVFSVNNFYNKIIVTEPMHGTPLYHTDHDGRSISIMMGRHIENTADKLFVDRAVPAPIRFPTAGAITYGSALSETPLGGYSGDGNFMWENPNTVPASAGLKTYNMVFLPRDVINYDYSNVTDWDGSKIVRPVQIQVNKATPTTNDFIINNLNQAADSVIPVTITPGQGKSIGSIVAIYYDGLTKLPQNAGTYFVTFDVAEAYNWNAAKGLYAGTLTVW